MITKLQFSLAVTFSITFTLGYLAGHTTEPAVWTLPILFIAGGSLYASRRLADQVHQRFRRLQTWLRYSDVGQSSPKLLNPENWKKP